MVLDFNSVPTQLYESLTIALLNACMYSLMSMSKEYIYVANLVINRKPEEFYYNYSSYFLTCFDHKHISWAYLHGLILLYLSIPLIVCGRYLHCVSDNVLSITSNILKCVNLLTKIWCHLKLSTGKQTQYMYNNAYYIYTSTALPGWTMNIIIYVCYMATVHGQVAN